MHRCVSSALSDFIELTFLKDNTCVLLKILVKFKTVKLSS